METIGSLQDKFFDLMRKRRFFDLAWVPTEREVATGCTRRSIRCCPDHVDNVELARVEAAIAAAGVRMYM
jgi:hypothetical protein